MTFCIRTQTSEINSFSDEAALAAINAAICDNIYFEYVYFGTHQIRSLIYKPYKLI